MSIRIPVDLYCRMALNRFENGDYKECLEFLRRCSISDRQDLRNIEAEASYRVGVSLCAEDRFGLSREYFVIAGEKTDDSSLKRICHRRLELIKKIITPGEYGLPPIELSMLGRACQDCFKKKTLYNCACCERYGSIVAPPKKLREGALQPEITAVYCVGAYRHGWDPQRSNPFSVAIRKLKQGEGKLIVEAFGHLMADFIDISCKNMRSIIDLIIPVPTNRDRLLQRGFGIPEKMAQVIERRFAIPAFTTVLALARSTANLRGLSKPERKRELKDAFKVRNASLIAGKTVLIIDDVVTYGTTLREVGRTLRRAGVQDVFAIVLAHTESSS